MSHSHDHGHDHSDSAYHHGHHHGGHDPWHEEHDHSHGDHSEDDEAERRHFLKVVDAFNHYQVNTLAMNAKRKRDWEQTIPEAHRALVPSFGAKLDAIDGLARENYQFIRQIIEEESPFPYEEAKTMHLEGSADVESDPVTEQDHDKVRSSLRQFVRDWSSEGAVERDRTYKPLVEALESHFSDLDIDERGAIYVLVPGAGLGRLAYDVARRGFSCQGNEFSYYMLLASNFILNKCSRPNQHTIFPWIHSLSNSVSAGDNIRGVTVPDVLPSDLMDTGKEYVVNAMSLEFWSDCKGSSRLFDGSRRLFGNLQQPFANRTMALRHDLLLFGYRKEYHSVCGDDQTLPARRRVVDQSG